MTHFQEGTSHSQLSDETVRRRLAEAQLKPWQEKMWCVPKLDAEYVARMEDVLALYAEPPDPSRPVVCFDGIRWMFTVDRAREKVGRVYPQPTQPSIRLAA